MSLASPADAAPYIPVHSVLYHVTLPIQLRRELLGGQRLLVVCLAPRAVAFVQSLRLRDFALAKQAAVLDPAGDVI
jgi:hypothetical protein